MLEVEKLNTDIGNKIVITKDNMSFGVLLSYENVLYLSLYGENNTNSFDIELSDGDIYNIVDKLYHNIRDVKYFYQKNLNEIEIVKNNSLPIENKVFNDDVIDYHSDDEEYDKSSSFILSKELNKYSIKIIPSKELKDNCVVMSIIGCRYGNAIFPFMRFYNDLNNYNFKTRKLTKKCYNTHRVDKYEFY